MAWKKQWQIDIAKEQIDDEQDILWYLEKNYKKALDGVNEKLKILNDRILNEGATSSILYQQQYQKALKSQIEAIYNDMYGTVYNGVSDYLKQSYEDGIVQSMYSLHKQGLDITIPIDQNEIALMASKSAIDGFKLSQKLYGNTVQMAKYVRDEITRGLITQLSYADIARNISNRTSQELSRTMRIARTEGHKVKMQSKMQSMSKAKDKGADIVKQWDSTLDGRTRQTHRMLDGQVREIDGKFKSSKGEAYYPGGFGIASEDINCRCSVLEIPRWALDDSDDVTKWNNEAGELLKSQQEIDLWKQVNNFPTEKTNKYNQFKKAYTKTAKKVSQQPVKSQEEIEIEKLEAEKQSELEKLEAEINELELNIDDKYDLDKKYENIWKDPVTLKDYKDKKDKVVSKYDYFENKINTSITSADKKKFEALLDLVEEFDDVGAQYLYDKQKIDKLDKKIKDLINDYDKKITELKNKIPKLYTYKNTQIDLNEFNKYFGKKLKTSSDDYKELKDLIKAKKLPVSGDNWKAFLKELENQAPLPYIGMSPSGGSINENCTWKKLYTNRITADKYFRDWADKTSYSLGDKAGQRALYEYTAGSGFINRPLSGYDGSWSRYDFKGLGKVDWDNERSIGKKSIEALTKLIDKTEPLKQGVVLRRGSSDSGLIGLFEGVGFDYDTIKKAYNDGSIVNFEGSVIKNHAFTSCGIVDGAGFHDSVDYIIKCPSGTKMVYAEPQSEFGRTIIGGQLYTPGMSYSSVGGEAEMILQRNTSFRIDKITKRGYSGYTVEMTVVDQDISTY